MGNYFGDVWSNLVFHTGTVTQELVNSLNWRLQKQMTQNVQFVSQSAYKSVLVHVAKQLAMSTLEGELNLLLPRYEKYARDQMLKAVRTQQSANRTTLIADGKKSTEGFGQITCEGDHVLKAKTKYGDLVPEALILSYLGEETIHFVDIDWADQSEEDARNEYTIRKKSTLEKLWNPGNEITHKPRAHKDGSFDTKTVFHIDLNPKVSMSSTKNVVLTQVQGRDFSRKELVSGGDLTYNVNGFIHSDQEGVYPAEAVKRFIKIMQYTGVIDVNYFQFGLLGVKQIIIKDFSLGAPDVKNSQPYSFSCVAVEPNDAIQLKQDTISVVNEILQDSLWDTWYKSILDNKLAQMAVKSALSMATTAATTGVGMGFDEFNTNI